MFYLHYEHIPRVVELREIIVQNITQRISSSIKVGMRKNI